MNGTEIKFICIKEIRNVCCRCEKTQTAALISSAGLQITIMLRLLMREGNEVFH